MPIKKLGNSEENLEEKSKGNPEENPKRNLINVYCVFPPVSEAALIFFSDMVFGPSAIGS